MIIMVVKGEKVLKNKLMIIINRSSDGEKVVSWLKWYCIMMIVVMFDKWSNDGVLVVINYKIAKVDDNHCYHHHNNDRDNGGHCC